MGGLSFLRRLTARMRGGNSREFWEKEYSGKGASKKWASESRLSFYDFAAEALPREPLRILDIGSGLGHGGRRLMDSCPLWKVEGFEISRSAAEQAVIPTACGDLLRDPIPTDYDYVLMVQTLEHFRDTHRVILRVIPSARRFVLATVPYRGRINRKHLASLSEDSFAGFPGATFHLRRRAYAKDGSEKIDLRVLIPAGGLGR